MDGRSTSTDIYNKLFALFLDLCTITTLTLTSYVCQLCFCWKLVSKGLQGNIALDVEEEEKSIVRLE